MGGLGMGETQLERRAALEAAIGALPADKPRHASGLGMIEEVRISLMYANILHVFSMHIPLFPPFISRYCIFLVSP